MTSVPATSGALARLISRTSDAPTTERCELCDAPVRIRHRHLLDTRDGNLLCICYACSVLFDRPAASKGHYRLVPKRRVQLPAGSPTEFGIPVGLAFFVAQPSGEVVAHYPSPLGVTTGEVEPARWAAAVATWPVLDSLAPAVEALLVHSARGQQEHPIAWLVPLDDCYQLVALIRRSWSGMSGGDEVWPQIQAFFAELATSSLSGHENATSFERPRR